MLNTLVFTITGLIHLLTGIFWKSLALAYMGVSAFVIAYWACLIHFEVEETQAFIIPFGLVLLGVGWYERTYQGGRYYKILSLIGATIMMGTAFLQSLEPGAWEYAVLVSIESIASLVWGLRTKSRGFVQVGGLALFANAIVQFGPSFIELPRWVHIGLTGIILLGSGLLALFRREKLLETRKRISEEWKQWEI